MSIKSNQNIPFVFLGTADDTSVYKMFWDLTTPGFRIDYESLKQTSITIIYPNDGMEFRSGQSIEIKLSHLYPDQSAPYSIEILANNQKVGMVGEKLQATWILNKPGIFILEAIVKDNEGKELYRSPKVDIIVKAD